jgi:hypothetical protein
MSITKRPSKQGVSSEKTPKPIHRLAYKLNDAAALIDVCPNTMRRLIATKQIKACGKLRHILVPHHEIVAFLGIKDAA